MSRLMWDVDHKLLYCPLYKVASGTWTTNFLRLAKYNEDLPKWQRFSKLHGASESVSRGMFPPPKSRKLQKKLLKESTKFLVVRHYICFNFILEEKCVTKYLVPNHTKSQA